MQHNVIAVLKRKLLSTTEDTAPSEWNEGYEAALKSVLSECGINATYVPATYTFSDEVPPAEESPDRVRPEINAHLRGSSLPPPQVEDALCRPRGLGVHPQPGMIYPHD